MQQVVDLQSDKTFGGLDVELLAISPDPLEAWQEEDARTASRCPCSPIRRTRPGTGTAPPDG